MGALFIYLRSSIGQKQITGISGILLVLFLIGHLVGNLFFYAGPETLNGYSETLHKVGPLLRIIQAGLVLTFLVHFVLTVVLFIQNRKARGQRYSVYHAVGKHSAKYMVYTGPIILAYMVFHLLDYTWGHHESAYTLVKGVDLGLYGLVFNSFTVGPAGIVRTIGYLIAMVAVGSHLTHAIQSFFQTMGMGYSKYSPTIKRISVILGVLISLIFCSIPIYLNIVAHA